MKQLTTLIKSCDIFGQSIMINFKNKNEYKTIFGGSFSIITVILVALLCSRQLQKLILKESFQIKLEDIINLSPPKVDILQTEFIFAMRIQDSNSNNYKNFFDINLYQKILTKNLTNNSTQKKTTQINLTQCTIEHFKNLNGGDLIKEFHEYNLQDYLCPQLNTSFSLQGYYNNDVFSYLKIEVVNCTKNCESQEIMEKYLEDSNFFKISFLASTFQVNPTSKEPLHLFLYDEIYFTFLPHKYYSRADFFLRKTILNEDKSIIPFMEEKVQKSIFQLSYEDVRANQIFDSKMDLFGEFYLRVASKSTIIEKTYSKLDDLLAYIGGILKLAFSFVALIVSNYNYYDLFINVANRLYNFDIPGKSNSLQQVNKKIRNMVSEIINKEQNPEKKKIYESVHYFFTHQNNQNRSEHEIKLEIFRSQKKLKLSQNNKLFEQKIDPELIKGVPEMKDQQRFINYVFEQLLQCKRILRMKLKQIMNSRSSDIQFAEYSVGIYSTKMIQSVK